MIEEQDLHIANRNENAREYFGRNWPRLFQELRTWAPEWVPDLSGTELEGTEPDCEPEEEARQLLLEYPHHIPQDSPGQLLDRRGWDLRGVNLSGSWFFLVDFSNADFSAANLCGVHFSRCRLVGAILTGIKKDDTTMICDPCSVDVGQNPDGFYRLQRPPFKEPSLNE